MSDPGDGDASTRTVVVAVAANLAITVAKGVAAVLTGSPALVAETAHSAADTGNELLLFVGVRRSGKPADRRHPFGYGQERYFWTFLAAIGIFLIGGALSIEEGITALRHPRPVESVPVGVAVLVVSMALESWSWVTARRQLRREAAERQRTVPQQLVRASDLTAGMVFLEDSAALVGLTLALAALGLHAWTGSAVWDAAASIAIGLLLVAVAYLVARRSATLLIDEAAAPDTIDRLRPLLDDLPWAAAIVEFQAVYMGPLRLLVTVTARPTARVLAGPAEVLVEHVAALRERLLASPVIVEAYVRLTTGPDGDGTGPETEGAASAEGVDGAGQDRRHQDR